MAAAAGSTLAVGLGLLPIAAAGLRKERLWGFIFLLVGLVVTLAIYPHAAYLHGICLVVTLVRFYLPAKQRQSGGETTVETLGAGGHFDRTR